MQRSSDEKTNGAISADGAVGVPDRGAFEGVVDGAAGPPDEVIESYSTIGSGDTGFGSASTEAIVSSGSRSLSWSPFQSVVFYVVCQGMVQLSYLILGSYLKSVITSIEKRFQIDSTTAGIMSSGFEIGNLLVILPVSYFGSRVHRPRAIAFGVLLVILGGFLLSVPHWMYPPHVPDAPSRSISSNSSDFDLCDGNANIDTDVDLGLEETPERVVERSRVWRLMFIARVFVGAGAAPIQPYGFSYMDDHASRAKAPLYLGVLLAISLVGPAIGYVLGSATTTLYIDFDRAPDPGLVPGDPGWIGAWWLGFLLASGFLGIVHLPFWFFPGRMRREEDEEGDQTASNRVSSRLELNGREGSDDDNSQGGDLLRNGNQGNENEEVSAALPVAARSADSRDTMAVLEPHANFWFYLKDFVVVAIRLLSNGAFLSLILAYATLYAISAGFAIFLPKYFQTQFGVTASTASFYVGAVQMPFGIVGVLLGGWVMRRWKLSLSAATATSVFLSILTLVIGVPLIFIGCDTRSIDGVNVNVTDPACLDRCHCDGLESRYEPVCATGIEYWTPCRAGCENAEFSADFDVETFLNCTCLPNKDANATVTAGACPSLCPDTFWTSLAINCCLLFVCSMVQSPIYTVLLRSVPQEDKSFAIGLQFLVMRTLGWMPAPVYFGAVIDSTCLKWTGKEGARGACKVYDNAAFRERYLGLISGLQGLGTVFLTILLLILLKNVKRR